MNFDPAKFSRAIETSAKTITEIARISGVSRGTIHSMINGDFDPKASSLGNVAEAIGRDVGDFFSSDSPINRTA